jgi:hypothetical protein
MLGFSSSTGVHSNKGNEVSTVQPVIDFTARLMPLSPRGARPV